MKLRFLILCILLGIFQSADAFWFLLRGAVMGGAVRGAVVSSGAVRGAVVSSGAVRGAVVSSGAVRGAVVSDGAVVMPQSPRVLRRPKRKKATQVQVESQFERPRSIKQTRVVDGHSKQIKSGEDDLGTLLNELFEDTRHFSTDLQHDNELNCKVFEKVNGYVVDILSYRGGCKDGHAHGVGEVFWQYKGKIGSYSGDFVNGKFHGIGRANYVEGISYYGDWRGSNESPNFLSNQYSKSTASHDLRNHIDTLF